MLDITPYRISPGAGVDLTTRDPGSKFGFEGDKTAGKSQMPALRATLAELQHRLWAERRQGLLVVLQAMDTGGKDGTIRSVFKGVNPQGVVVAGFGVPSQAELDHDYLWRIHQRAPARGTITVFNRSHYEDVLVVRVKGLVPEDRWRPRFHHIREFERALVDEGIRVVKLFLHISRDEQAERLQSRLDQPEKRWKFNKSDLDDRILWEEFQTAYQDAIAETSTEFAPWYVVPANRKWYRNLVVSSILIETLTDMSPRYPDPEDDLQGIVVT